MHPILLAALILATPVVGALVIAACLVVYEWFFPTWKPVTTSPPSFHPSLEYLDRLRSEHEVPLETQPASVAMMAADPDYNDD